MVFDKGKQQGEKSAELAREQGENVVQSIKSNYSHITDIMLRLGFLEQHFRNDSGSLVKLHYFCDSFVITKTISLGSVVSRTVTALPKRLESDWR